MCKKSERIKITRTLSPESFESLRTKAFMMKKSQSAILDDLLSGWDKKC